MKKLLVLLALCMVLSIVMVACEEPVTPPAETTQGTTTDAPTTDAPTTEEPTTEEITTAPGTTETDTTTPPETSTEETTTPPPPPADPVTKCLSFDELSMITDGNAVGFFAPGQSGSWDKIANVEDYNVDTIKVWGWAGFFAETIGEFGYQIGDAEPVFDAAFVHATEQAVVDAAAGSGAKSASRFAIMIPVEYVGGEGIVVKALARDAAGTIETLVEFTLNKPANPNAPLFVLDAADIAGATNTNEMASNTLSADGTYTTIVGANDGQHGDLWLSLISSPIQGAQYVVIKYRTSLDRDGQIFIGSAGGPSGSGDCPMIDYTSDGNWQLAVIDLAQESITSIDKDTYTIAYLRFDAFTDGKGDATIDVAYIAAFNSVEAAEAYDAQFKGVYINTLNTSMDSWTVSGHAPGLTGSDSADKGSMITAGGLEKGALLHQGSIGLGELNLAQFSKMIVYYGIDNSQVTIDRWTASANNRVMITNVDTNMTDSPAEENIVASAGYELKGWSLVAVEIDLTGVDYAGPVFVSYDTLPGTFMLVGAIELVYDPYYAEPENPDPENPDPENPDPEVILSTDKTTYTVGESIMVTAIGGGTDWIGIAPKGVTDGSLRWWYIDPVDGYVSVGSGVPFDAVNGEANYGTEGPLTAGEYVIVIIPNDQPFASGDFKATVEITITE